MLRQGDGAMFTRYGLAKHDMMREALSNLDRQAEKGGATALRCRPQK